MCLIKKKALFTKKFAFKNHFLGMKLKVSFSKRDFGGKKIYIYSKEMGYQTDSIWVTTWNVYPKIENCAIHTLMQLWISNSSLPFQLPSH